MQSVQGKGEGRSSGGGRGEAMTWTRHCKTEMLLPLPRLSFAHPCVGGDGRREAEMEEEEDKERREERRRR